MIKCVHRFTLFRCTCTDQIFFKSLNMIKSKELHCIFLMLHKELKDTDILHRTTLQSWINEVIGKHLETLQKEMKVSLYCYFPPYRFTHMTRHPWASSQWPWIYGVTPTWCLSWQWLPIGLKGPQCYDSHGTWTLFFSFSHLLHSDSCLPHSWLIILTFTPLWLIPLTLMTHLPILYFYYIYG